MIGHWDEHAHTCVYIHTHTNIYIYIYIYILRVILYTILSYIIYILYSASLYILGSTIANPNYGSLFMNFLKIFLYLEKWRGHKEVAVNAHLKTNLLVAL